MEKTFRFRETDISYKVEGKGKTLILMHGFLGNKELWNQLFHRWKKHFRVVSVDLPGHGRTPAIGYVHDMEMIAEAIHALYAAIKIRKAYLLGHSMGGYVALAFAETYPDKLSGLILMNTTAQSDSKQRIQSRNQLIRLLKKDKEKAIKALIPSFFEGSSNPKAVKKYVKAALNCDVRGIIANIEGMKKRVEREIVLKFAPYHYCYIIGKEDPLLPAKQLIREAKLSENGLAYVLDDTSHMAFLEQEGRVYKLVKQFCKS